MNVAVTFCICVIVTTQSPVPLQPAPLHPLNENAAEAGAGASVTWEFCAKFAEQTGPAGIPQLMPEGELNTNPLLAGVIVTLSAKAVFVAVPDNGKLKLGFAGSFVVMFRVPVRVPATPPGGTKLMSTTPPEDCGGTMIVQGTGAVPVGVQPKPIWNAEGWTGEEIVRIKSSSPVFSKIMD